MADLRPRLIVYMSHDNEWELACKWAKDNGYLAKTVKQRCYKRFDDKAAMYYGDTPQMHADYQFLNIPRLEL